MDAKLYPLAFYAMAISNYCECALDDRYLSNIFHKLDEVKQSLLIEMGEKISTLENKAGEKIYTLENKVDRLLNAMQGCHRYNDTRDCPALLVENAMVNPGTDTIPHGSLAAVTCVPGFTIVGKSTLRCLEGKYDSIPSCKADCKTLTISNAVVRPATKVAHGTTVQVVCLGINTLVGESMVTCYDGYYEYIPKCVFDISTVNALSSENIPIKVKEDRQTPAITGTEFLPDGRLLVVDNANEKVKLLSSSLTYEGSVDVDRPYAIAAINKTTAIVSSESPTEPHNQLHFISVISSLRLQSAIPLEQPCFGIDVYNGTIYITCHKVNEGEGHVKLFDMDGNLIRTLGVTEIQGQSYYMFRRPISVRLSRFTGNVYVADWAAHTVTCLSPTGEVIFQFSNIDALENPVDFILDDRDSILIVGKNVDLLEIINNEQNYKILPRNGDALPYPGALSLAYRQTDGVLLVGGYSSENIILYQLVSIS